MSLITAVRNYIMKFPNLDEEALLNVDKLGSEAIEYSISPIPSEPILKEYINGDTLKKYDFLFLARSRTDVLTQYIDNQDFFEGFSDWLRTNTELKIFPALEVGKIPQKIIAINAGYMSDQDVSGESAVYRVNCQLIYRQKGD